MVNAPQVSLKVIVLVHFVLTTWAAMAVGFLPPAYLYMNAVILAFGVWSIISTESVEAVLMFLATNLISVIMDIVFLGVFAGHYAGIYSVHTYRFSLGMAIVNLLVKPFSCFVLYKLYQDRGGQYSDFGIPGMPGFGGNAHGGAYENIDQSVPSSVVESASPHNTFPEKSPSGLP